MSQHIRLRGSISEPNIDEGAAKAELVESSPVCGNPPRAITVVMRELKIMEMSLKIRGTRTAGCDRAVKGTLPTGSVLKTSALGCDSASSIKEFVQGPRWKSRAVKLTIAVQIRCEEPLLHGVPGGLASAYLVNNASIPYILPQPKLGARGLATLCVKPPEPFSLSRLSRLVGFTPSLTPPTPREQQPAHHE